MKISGNTQTSKSKSCYNGKMTWFSATVLRINKLKQNRLEKQNLFLKKCNKAEWKWTNVWWRTRAPVCPRRRGTRDAPGRRPPANGAFVFVSSYKRKANKKNPATRYDGSLWFGDHKVGKKRTQPPEKKRKWGNGRMWFRGNLRREMKKTESGALWNIGTFHEHHLPVLELLTAQQVDVDEFGVGTPARRHQFHQSRLRRRLSHRNPPPKKRNPVKHFRWCCHHHLSRSIESLWVEFLFFQQRPIGSPRKVSQTGVNYPNGGNLIH